MTDAGQFSKLNKKVSVLEEAFGFIQFSMTQLSQVVQGHYIGRTTSLKNPVQEEEEEADSF